MTGTDDPATDEDTPSSSLGDLADSIRKRQGRESDSETRDSVEGDSFEWSDVGENGSDDEQSRGTDGLPTAIDDPADVLLLGPLRGTDCDRNCVSLLSLAPPDRTNMLAVTVTRSANDWLSMWQQHSPASAASLTIVSLGDETRGESSSTTISTPNGSETITIETVADPSDLTRLGVTLSRLLSEVTTPEERTAVCVHSLTALLQYIEPRRLFRFLHLLRGKLDSVDASAHYHLDPGAHDEQTVGLFRSLFDTVVRITEEGDLEVVSASG